MNRLDNLIELLEAMLVLFIVFGFLFYIIRDGVL
tara:strand:+ start:509 stop:610 length:102 start_codon:yes stop_codon:yes gene_type:complete